MSTEQQAVTALRHGPHDTEEGPRTRRRQLRQFVVPLLLVVEICVFAVLSDTFLTAGNLANVALNSVDLALIAAGLTLVIILGGIDVSTGPALGVIAWCVGTLTLAGAPALLVVTAAVVLGCLMGLLNGVLVSLLGVTAIIATLGTAAIWQTTLFALWGGSDLFAPPVSSYAAGERLLGVPTSAFLALLAYLVLWYVSRYRAFGRHVFAVGNDIEGARLSGVDVRRVQVAAFVLVGGMVGLAAVVYMARIGVVQASSGADLSLAAIAAVVVGGTSITGGRGSVIGTLFGVVFIAILQNGVVLIGVPPLWNGVLVGAFILIAVAVDVLSERLSSPSGRKKH
jgi:ribose/xylose/arabinose/galactoside ABC-type transport system permease subunit